MELWIRSQDKECITLVNHLYANVYGEIKQQQDLVLGVYDTKERALDEIENAILYGGADYDEVKEMKINFKSWFATNVKTGVSIYEMPQE